MFWLRKVMLELGNVVVASALHQQHARCNKTSPVSSFGTEMQHRQHFGLRQRVGCVSDTLHDIF